jgi:hypothetical protein
LAPVFSFFHSGLAMQRWITKITPEQAEQQHKRVAVEVETQGQLLHA